MIRERIADDVYVFTSRRYAQVTCGAILTREGAVLIDTLFFPDEARAVSDFVERRLNHPVRYVINTHYHADHTMGTYLYPHATVVSHSQCRTLLDSVGRKGLEQTKIQMPEFQEVNLILPSLVVAKGTLDIALGGKTIRLLPLPGHSLDLMGVYILDSQILFTSDAVMPIPTFFDGDYHAVKASLQKIAQLEPDTLVQGHGEVVLRGEITNTVQNDIDYLDRLYEEVANLVKKGKSAEALKQIRVESCGKSRIALNGLAEDLHFANARHLYHQLVGANA